MRKVRLAIWLAIELVGTSVAIYHIATLQFVQLMITLLMFGAFANLFANNRWCQLWYNIRNKLLSG
jgi:hypothetical protein